MGFEVEGGQVKGTIKLGQWVRPCPAAAVGLLAASLLVQACGADDRIETEYARRLGEQVIEVGDAIRDPSLDGAMDAIVELGTDSRHYTMVRGWLTLQLQGDRSILEASEPGTRPRIEQRVEFLQRAIRAIDLE